MLIDLPAHWSGDAMDPPQDMAAQMARLAAVETILGQAARATCCAAAIICTLVDGQLVRLAGSRDGPLRDVLPHLIGRAAADKAAPCAVQAIGEAPVTLEFHGEFGGDVRFAAASPIAGMAGALLLVIDNHVKPDLNAAQTYVMRSHAAHLATLFDLASRRERVALADSAANQADLERLRLLELVAVHARDSIIITEAEPLDLPGPQIIYCNAAFTRATGYAADEVIGRTPRILQGPKTDPVSRARLRRAFEAWESLEIELINYRKDGT